MRRLHLEKTRAGVLFHLQITVDMELPCWELQQEMAQSWHLDKSRPYPAYMLSNNNAEIRRRLKALGLPEDEDIDFLNPEIED